MSVLQHGTVVWIQKVVSPSGGKAKDRPVLVIEPATEAKSTARCVVIATLRSSRHNPNCEVIIPYRKDGHPRTTLTQPSVAVCNWVIEVIEDDILPGPKRGRCQQDITNEVIRTMSLLLEETNGNHE